MSSLFRLRRRDLRWLLFPALAIAAGLLVLLVVVFTPGRVLAGYEFSKARAPLEGGPVAAAHVDVPQAH